MSILCESDGGMKWQSALAIISIFVCSPVSAHRYCQGIDAEGRFARITPDLNNERTEYWLEVESIYMPSGERTHAVVFSGMNTPICSIDECERYRRALKLDKAPKPNVTIRFYCAPH